MRRWAVFFVWPHQPHLSARLLIKTWTQEEDNSAVTQRGAATEGDGAKEEGQKEGTKDEMSALKKVSLGVKSFQTRHESCKQTFIYQPRRKRKRSGDSDDEGSGSESDSDSDSDSNSYCSDKSQKDKDLEDKDDDEEEGEVWPFICLWPSLSNIVTTSPEHLRCVATYAWNDCIIGSFILLH